MQSPMPTPMVTFAPLGKQESANLVTLELGIQVGCFESPG